MTFPDIKTNLVTALAALTLGCTAIAAQPDAADAAGGLACTVQVTPSRGMLLIEGVVASDEAIAGTYQLRVERRGSLMNQGGPFQVRAGETTTLGRVQMNGPATGLSADLTLNIDGQTARCPVDL